MLGVDPGKHTGLALVDLWSYQAETPGLLVRCGLKRESLWTAKLEELPGYLNYFILLAHNPKLRIACEQFIVTEKTAQSQDAQAIEAIGMLKAIMWLRGVPAGQLSLTQKPSDAKPLITNQQLYRLGLRDVMRGQSVHSKDALRHAVLWCTRYVRNLEQV